MHQHSLFPVRSLQLPVITLGQQAIGQHGVFSQVDGMLWTSLLLQLVSFRSSLLAALLILREFMHHLNFAHVTLQI